MSSYSVVFIKKINLLSLHHLYIYLPGKFTNFLKQQRQPPDVFCKVFLKPKLFARCLLLVSFCSLLITFCSLLATFCSLLVTFYSFLVTFCWLLVTFCSLLVSFCSLFVSFCRCSLLVTFYSLLVKKFWRICILVLFSSHEFHFRFE